MADEPDATPIDPSPPPAEQPPQLAHPARGSVRFSRAVGGGGPVESLQAAARRHQRSRRRRSTRRSTSCDFLYDVTSADVFGAPVVRQQIFDVMLDTIAGARQFIVVDFFLFNGHRGAAGDTPPHRALSAELRDALLARKRALPGLTVLVISDPINDVYGSIPSPDLAALRDAGIEVVVIDLDELRDSNFIYSAFWRLTMKWWSGDGSGDGWLPNPLAGGPEEVTFGAWARLLNFKANHRKVLIADDGKGGLTGIVTSANPHDASSRHSNVALKLSGAALQPLLESELALARESGWDSGWQPPPLAPAPPIANPVNAARVQVLTEGRDRRGHPAQLRADPRRRQHRHRDVLSIRSQRHRGPDRRRQAWRRGAGDPRPQQGRFRSREERYPEPLGGRGAGRRLRRSDQAALVPHARRAVPRQARGDAHRRRILVHAGIGQPHPPQLGDYNLEANIAVSVPPAAELAVSIGTWFEMLWSNKGPPDLEYTADFGTYADPAQGTYWLYRLMETTGMCTF